MWSTMEAESIISGRERERKRVGDRSVEIFTEYFHTLGGQFARSYFFLPCMFSKALHYVFIRVSLLLLIIPMVCILLFHTRGNNKTNTSLLREQRREDEENQSHRTVSVFRHLLSDSTFSDVRSDDDSLVNKRWSSHHGGKGGGGNINICTQGRPPHHLSSMPLPEAPVSYFCQKLHYCSLMRNFSDAAQWLNEFVSQSMAQQHNLGSLWELSTAFISNSTGQLFCKIKRGLLNSFGFLSEMKHWWKVESNTAMVTLTSKNGWSVLYPRVACQ